MGKLSEWFLKKQASRLKLTSLEEFCSNLYYFADLVIKIESDGNINAKAKTTSAKGLFQFTAASVDTGKNRMGNMGFDIEDIREIDRNPCKWTNEQSYCMFFANIFAQRGSDKLLVKVAKKDIDSMKDAYYKFHHTNPDEATIKRVDKIMVS